MESHRPGLDQQCRPGHEGFNSRRQPPEQRGGRPGGDGCAEPGAGVRGKVLQDSDRTGDSGDVVTATGLYLLDVHRHLAADGGGGGLITMMGGTALTPKHGSARVYVLLSAAYLEQCEQRSLLRTRPTCRRRHLVTPARRPARRGGEDPPSRLGAVTHERFALNSPRGHRRGRAAGSVLGCKLTLSPRPRPSQPRVLRYRPALRPTRRGC